MTDTAFKEGPHEYGHVEIFAVFRCKCGKLCGMANQVPSGNAALMHQDPRCDRFNALRNQEQALRYFRKQKRVPLSVAKMNELAATCSP